MNRSLRRRAEKIAGKPSPSVLAAQHFALGVRHQMAGAHVEACDAYRKTLALQPGHAEAHYGLALAQHHQGKFDGAIDSYRKAIAFDPRHSFALNNLGVLLKDTGQLQEAETVIRRSLETEPASPLLLGNLAAVLADRGEWERAVEAVETALAKEPLNVSLLTTYSRILREQGKIDQAVSVGLRAAEAHPNSVVAQHNLGVAHYNNGQNDESLIRFRNALTLDPGRVESHFALAMALLARGDFVQGFDEYEWRWRLKDYAWIETTGFLKVPRWQGEDLRDRTLVLCCEQGLGDTLQFLRFLPLALTRAKHVALWIQPGLKALCRNIEGVTLYGMDQVIDRVDVYCPLLSLPRLFAATPATLPPVAPYFKSDRQSAQRWRARLGAHGFKVGVAWQGKPGSQIDRGRSIPLSALAPLARIPGVRLISLQKNFGTEQLSNLPPGMTVETLGDDFDAGPGAFLDSAAVMESLDLVVASDSSVAHLAGSLERPTWLALKRIPDWRWGRTGAETPWYPSMRLFRQSRDGDWEGVFRAMAEALAPLATSAARTNAI